MLWWLYRENHITRRQLRIVFAAHELAEQRRCAQLERDRKPLYRIEEVAALVGGGRSETALRALKGDVKQLAALGLVYICDHEISFATSIEQVRIEEISTFWPFFKTLNEADRCAVPVPRRMLRALAGGFSRAMTGYILTALTRSVFYQAKSKRYRIDGRMKLGHMAQALGISRRQMSDARARLIELGWLQPLEVPSWARNRWGVHDIVNVDWKTTSPESALPTESADEIVENSTETQGRDEGKSASPQPQNKGKSASPYKQTSSSLMNLKNRDLRCKAPEQPGVFTKTNKKKKKLKPTDKPNIRDIQPEHLRDVTTLLDLHRQATEQGLFPGGESGQFDFVSLANRARSQGRAPEKLFFWLVKHRSTDRIRFADEEAARSLLREYREGPAARQQERRQPSEFSEEERFVQACLQVGKQHRREPFQIAQAAKGWNEKQWEDAVMRFRQQQFERQEVFAGCVDV